MEQEKALARSVNSDRIWKLTICAMFIALTYIATAFINIRLPIMANGGLIHLGNVPLFVAAVVFGKKTGAVAGGVGMGMFDLLGGWVYWAPFTLVIVGMMGFVSGLITEKKKGFGWLMVAFFFALLIKIAGYYFAEGVIYGNWIAPLTSIPGNIVQVVAGAIIAVPLIEAMKRIVKTRR